MELKNLKLAFSQETKIHQRSTRNPQKSTPRGPAIKPYKNIEFDNSIVNTTADQTVRNIEPQSAHSKTSRKYKHQNYQQVKRIFLTKILINRAINIRSALKQLDSVPSSLFKKGTSLDIAHSLISKSKITLQTSLLRTLFFSYNDKPSQQPKFKITSCNNTFVIGTNIKQNGEHKKAILLLSEICKNNIRFVVKQFSTNRKQVLAVRRFLFKMYSNHVKNCSFAFELVKNLPKREEVGGIDESALVLCQLATVLQRINDNSLSLQREILNNIRSKSFMVKMEQRTSAKLIISFAKIRRQQAFLIWQDTTYDCRKKKQISIQIEQQKMKSLRRIVSRNYLKLFKQINRRVYVIQKVATRLACKSRINEQKALWRLLLNAEKGCIKKKK